jgi:hypothetical protein
MAQLHIVYKPVQENYGYTISQTVTALPTFPNNALEALIQVESADIRVHYDGKNQSDTGHVSGGAGGGFLWFSGESQRVAGWDNLNRWRAIRDSGSNATINVVFNGEGQP